MGFFSEMGGILERINDRNMKKEETEFEKTQKYIKEVEEKIKKERNLKTESELKNINLDDDEKNLNWHYLRSKQDVENDLKEETIEDKWKKLDKMLEDN
ncbi:hypothetical protein [uncultured Parvimonas sp.]|uniref:hypothetical protein n=1 Tax=uncultured Parvimonas sp. TaxID=747372 RepID=UPI00325F9D11